MTFPSLTDSLSTYISIIRKNISYLVWFESVIIVAIGLLPLLLSDQNTQLEKRFIWGGIGFFVMLEITIIWIKNKNFKNFPGDIINELRYERSFKMVSDEFERNKELGKVLNKVICLLNDQTCGLGNHSVSNIHFCESGITSGLNALLSPLISNPQLLFGYPVYDYSSFIYLNSYAVMESEGISKKEGIISINLSPTISEVIPDNIKTLDEGVKLDIQQKIIKAVRNKIFLMENIIINNQCYSIIISLIPDICEPNKIEGVWVNILPKIELLPTDLQINLDLFGTVMINWLNKYNECVEKRVSYNESIVKTPAELQ